jgi:hypothetical protein
MIETNNPKFVMLVTSTSPEATTTPEVTTTTPPPLPFETVCTTYRLVASLLSTKPNASKQTKGIINKLETISKELSNALHQNNLAVLEKNAGNGGADNINNSKTDIHKYLTNKINAFTKARNALNTVQKEINTAITQLTTLTDDCAAYPMNAWCTEVNQLKSQLETTKTSNANLITSLDSLISTGLKDHSPEFNSPTVNQNANTSSSNYSVTKNKFDILRTKMNKNNTPCKYPPP